MGTAKRCSTELREREQVITRKRAQIISATSDETMLKQALVGASLRSLAEVFGADAAEFNKVTRFFRPG